MEKIDCTIPLESGMTHILFNLAAQGIKELTVNFNGEGSSFEVWNIEGIVNEDFESNVSGNWVELLTNRVKDIMDTHFEEGWNDEEGGYGRMTIDTAGASFKVSYHERIMTYNDLYTSGDIGD